MTSLLSTPDWNHLANQALAGDVISREAAHQVLDAPDTELLAQTG
jgi:biotin synthase